MRVRGPAEQAESTETERFKKSRDPLLSAREAGPRTELPADETAEAKGQGGSLKYAMRFVRVEAASSRLATLLGCFGKQEGHDDGSEAALALDLASDLLSVNQLTIGPHPNPVGNLAFTHRSRLHIGEVTVL